MEHQDGIDQRSIQLDVAAVATRKSDDNNSLEAAMQRTWRQAVALAVLVVAGAGSLAAQREPMVGGQAMYPSKDIIDNAVNSADHTTLVAAVKAADLVGTLKGKGPFTVFAPTNAAFKLLPDGTVETLLKPENKGMLTSVLTYHVVPGRYDAKALMDLIHKGHGQASLKTVNGANLTFVMNGDRNIIVKDAKGSQANIAVYDVYQSNGVILVIDKVLLPA
jgi:uncharacterized surface protein with fasciclin (FAS1) repeats